MLQTKAEKKLILAGAAQFNRKPKAGIAFLEEHKLIYQDLSDTVDKNKSLAMFLKSCNRIDKKVLGEFLAKPENLDLLKTFMSLIDFKGVSYRFLRNGRRNLIVIYAYRKTLQTPCASC